MSMNHHSAWNNVNDDNGVDAIVDYSNNANNVNINNNMNLPAAFSSNHNCSQS